MYSPPSFTVVGWFYSWDVWVLLSCISPPPLNNWGSCSFLSQMKKWMQVCLSRPGPGVTLHSDNFGCWLRSSRCCDLWMSGRLAPRHVGLLMDFIILVKIWNYSYCFLYFAYKIFAIHIWYPLCICLCRVCHYKISCKLVSFSYVHYFIFEIYDESANQPTLSIYSVQNTDCDGCGNW